MNAMGKELMAKRIVEVIKCTIKVCRKKPISLKWKEDTSTGNRGTEEAAEEGRGRSGNRTVSVQAEDNNGRRQENETEVKASRRSRKVPVTRKGDFLWTVNCTKHSR